jgi:MFS family permease
VTETPKRLYYGWIMLVVVVFVMLAGSGIRAVFGVFIKPIEAEFGWSRAQLSGAAALSLFVLGAVGPMVGWLADVWGPRRVMLLATAILGAGTCCRRFVGHLRQFYIQAGLLMAWAWAIGHTPRPPSPRDGSWRAADSSRHPRRHVGPGRCLSSRWPW